MLNKYFYSATIPAIIASSAMFAAPLQSTRGLPPEGTIIAHVDADAFRTAKFGKTAMELIKVSAKKENSTAAKANEKEIEDFLSKISDVTIGAIDAESNSVVIIRGKFTEAQILKFLKDAGANPTQVKIGKRSCYSAEFNSPTTELSLPQIGNPDLGKNESTKQSCIFTAISEPDKSIILLTIGEKESIQSTFSKAINDYDSNKSMPIPASIKSATGTPIISVATIGNALKDETFADFSSTSLFLGEKKDLLTLDATGTCKSKEIASQKAIEAQQMLGIFAMVFTMAPMENTGSKDANSEKIVRDFISKILASTKISSSDKDVKIASSISSEAIIQFVKNNIDISKQEK